MELSPTAHQDTFTRDNLPPADQWPVIEFTVDEVRYPKQLNAATALIGSLADVTDSDRPALHTPAGETWGYGQLRLHANQVAQVLTEDLGVVPGNRVLLRGPNNPWLVAAWLGVLKAGAVVVTTMPVLRSNELHAICEATRPVAAIIDHRFVDGLSGALEGLTVLNYGSDEAEDLTARCSNKSGVFEDVATAADDVALLAPTSGTTGVPKITMHFHRDILATADTFAKHILKPTVDDVFAGSPPLAFTFGLGGLVVFPLRFGAASLLTERATPVDLARHAAAAGATILFTAPTAYRAILKEGQAALLKSLRLAISAGEHLPKETWEAVYEASGLRLINGIGSTEMLHVFISASADDIRPGATGLAVPGFGAKIIDEDGRDAAPNEPGRLAVIGPTGCRYLKDERQLTYVRDGWNVTGDTFMRDEEGYFHYVARADDLIISSGYNIGAAEVEEAVNLHPDVVESGVVGLPDAERGNVICAFVVLRQGVHADAAKRKEIQDFVKATIAPYKYPRHIKFVDSVPRNPSGKLQHFKLREEIEREEFPMATTEPSQQPVSTG
ncbi:2-aminobenzoate-CoA ligase [Paenarthrobacter nicotinovorans]|uniref:AMP-binding protein n=1 Tax=Paenarthrobacter nicotinovorans TaxID=29320 RepID=UPI00278A3747|nr:AMP-binding protein [Paenarthrobacter nicotinovorans]MDP9936902.1 2-aminobenzoate-CoA ligase [Paenarthrobacter nicotinovorans]